MPKSFAEGVITAVGCAPEIPMPPEWMPWVFSQHADHTVELDWEAVTDALVKSLRDTLSVLRRDELPYPPEYKFNPDDARNSAQACWLRGFLFAHQALQPVWQKAWEQLQTNSLDEAEAAAKSLQHCLKVMSVLADPDMINNNDGQTLTNNLPAIAKTLPRTLKQYIDLANNLASFLPNQFEQFTRL